METAKSAQIDSDALNFSLDYQQGEGHGDEALISLLNKYNGKVTELNDRLVVLFPDKSVALSLIRQGGWEIKDNGCKAIGFIFDFLQSKQMNQQVMQSLVDKHDVIKKENGATLVFSDNSSATWSDENNAWLFAF